MAHDNRTVTPAPMLPCPFCGSEIIHIRSWAKSFNPPRLYHEWHHEDQDPECQIFRFGGKIVASSTDDAVMQEDAIRRWNRRSPTAASALLDAAPSTLAVVPNPVEAKSEVGG